MTAERYYEFSIGDRIRAARVGSGMDQAALAEATDLSRTTISNYESGQTTRVPKGSVRRIAWATGYSFDWLLTGNVPPTSGHTRTGVWTPRLVAA